MGHSGSQGDLQGRTGGVGVERVGAPPTGASGSCCSELSALPGPLLGARRYLQGISEKN